MFRVPENENEIPAEYRGIENPVFGELDDKGQIKRDVKVSAWSGTLISEGDMMIHVSSTNKFYRLRAHEPFVMTADDRQRLEGKVAPQVPVVAPSHSFAAPSLKLAKKEGE